MWFSSPRHDDNVNEGETTFSLNEEVHTPHHPYCSDLSCWCHTSVAYHAQVQFPQPTEVEVQQAYSFFGLFHC